MCRNNWVGGDGWTYYPKTIKIADNCPICGKKRGVPQSKTFCEDGEWFTVDVWENPCNHIDKYQDCYFEAEEFKKKKL